MKITAPISRVEEIEILAAAGADEFTAVLFQSPGPVPLKPPQ